MRRAFITCIGLLAAGALMAQPGQAQNPYTQPDDTWISIDGTVESVTADAFLLDFGDGTVFVEMDDGDGDADGYKLVEGDKVTVTGIVDDDFFETASIEASSVYVESLGTYFYASPEDEEDFRDTYITITGPVTTSRTVVQGRVTSIGDGEFTIDTGAREITVEVDEMTYDPLAEDGYQTIHAGDQVSVTGRMDADLFEGRELQAHQITELALH